MREDLVFVFAMVQAIGALFAVLAFFGLNWKRLKERVTGKGQIPMFNEKPQRRPLLFLMLLLTAGSIAFSAVGWYRSPSLQIGNCKSLLLGWGVSGPKMFIMVDTDLVIDFQKSSHLVLIGRPADHTIDAKLDKNIVKSGIFGINGGRLQIEAMTNDEFMKRVIDDGGWVEFHVVMVPKDVDMDKIATLADADRLGGKDFESRAFLIPLVAVPIPNQQNPPNGKPNVTPGLY
jgi:hypothetical protein